MFFRKNKNKVDDDDDMDLDEFDFDDLDDFDDFDAEPRKPTTKDLAKQVGKSAATTAAKDIAKQTAKDLIPGDFESNLYEVKDFANHTKDLLQKSKEEITGSLSKVLPKSIAEKLGLASNEQEARRASEQEARDAGIQNSLDSIFNKQQNIEKKMEETKEVSREVNIESSKMAISKMQTDVMGGMSNDISKLSGFFLNIGSEYFKKSLELQYKSYYLQMDILKTSNTYFKGFSEQFDRIVKNTGLPEHVKITQADRLGAKMKEEFTNKVYQSAYSNNAFIQNIKKNIERKIKDGTSLVKDQIEQVGSMFEMSSDAGGVGGIAARLGGDWIGGKISKKFMDKFSPKLKEKFEDNENLKTLGHFTDALVHNTGTMAEMGKKMAKEQREAAEETEGFKGTLSRGVWNVMNQMLDLTNYKSRDMRFTERTMDDISAPAIFDNNVYYKVADAIPAYLGRILQQNTDLTNMYNVVNRKRIEREGGFKPAPLLVYNYLSRKLETVTSYRNAVSASLGKRDKDANIRAAASKTVDGVISQFNDDPKANKKKLKTLRNKGNRELLERYLTEVGAKDDINGDTDILFMKALDPDAHEDVKKFIKDNPKIRSLIELMQEGTKEGGVVMKERVAKDFKVAKEDTANDFPIGTIKSLFEGASMLSENGEIKNTLNNSEAAGVGYAFAYYIKTENKDLLPDVKILQEVFKKIPADTPHSVLGPVKVFIDDVETIMSGSKSRKLELIKLFGAMNIAIRQTTHASGEGVDKEMERYTNIDRADPNLFDGQKEVTIETMFKRTLGGDSNKTTDFLEGDELDDIFKDRNIKEIRDFIGDKKLFEGLTQGAKDEMSKGDTWAEKISILAKYSKAEAGKVLDKARAKFDKTIENLGAEFNKLKDKSIEYAYTSIIKYLKKLEDDIDEVTKKETDSFNDLKKNLQQAISSIAENAVDTDDIENLEKEIEELQKKHDERMSGYKVLKNIINEMKRELAEINDGNEENKVVQGAEKTREAASKLLKVLMEKLEELKGLFSKLKKEDV